MYKVTCYCNDAAIKTIKINIPYISKTYSVNYGSSDLGEYDDYTVSSLEEKWTVKFTATAASGYTFFRWVYRIGSTSSTVQYSYDATFSYSGGQDIYIRAEGQSTSGKWALKSIPLGTLDEFVSENPTISKKTLYRYEFTPKYSGELLAFSSGDLDVCAYLSTSSAFNETTGEPSSYLQFSSGSEQFQISYNVQSEKKYYLFIRSYSENDSGAIYVYIEPPAEKKTWSLNSSSYGTVTSDKSETVSIQRYTLHRRTMSFEKGGTAKFYTSGNTDTLCFLSVSANWNRNIGEPTDYLEWDDDSAGDSNASITYKVSKGVTYYFWVRGYYDDKGKTTIHISPPIEDEPTQISKWDWNASNGTATAKQTISAYGALKNKSEIQTFEYAVWNDLVEKVNEIITSAGDEWDTYYDTLSNTKMTSSDRTLTANRFNSLRYNIGARYSTGINEVQQYEKVLARYFTLLAECINAWIDTL